MQLPFTVAQFYGVFRDYNTALWPAQVALLALALAALVLVVWRRPASGRVVSAILAFLWAWLALAYHVAFFAAINPLADAVAALSLLGATAFAWQGVGHGRLRFRLAADARTALGVALIAYALLVYPAWSVLAGHRYPALPTFGLPCPTTIYTIGLLAFAQRPQPRGPLVVPVLWSFIGGQAALLLDVPQDLGLFVAGVAGLGLIASARGPVTAQP